MPQSGNAYITTDNTFIKLVGQDTVKFYQNGSSNPELKRDTWELQLSVGELFAIHDFIQSQINQLIGETTVTEPETVIESIAPEAAEEVAIEEVAAQNVEASGSIISSEDAVEGGDAESPVVAPEPEPTPAPSEEPTDTPNIVEASPIEEETANQ